MRGQGYWREISAVLALKTIGIVVLYCLFVVPMISGEVTPARMATHLVAPADGQSINPLPAR